VSIVFFDFRSPAFHYGYKNMLATANAQEASFIRAYTISFDNVVSLPPFLLLLLVFL
jgi:hypothetical protein